MGFGEGGCREQVGSGEGARVSCEGWLVTTADALKSRMDRIVRDARDFLDVNGVVGIPDAERLRADILTMAFDPASLGRDLLNVHEAQRAAVARINTAIEEALLQQGAAG